METLTYTQRRLRYLARSNLLLAATLTGLPKH